MSAGPTCGLWPGARGLFGAVVDPDGVLVQAGTIRPTEDGEVDEHDLWYANVERFHGPGLEVVVTPRLARHHRAARLALELGHQVWVAPANVVALIVSTAWWRPTPRHYAVALARLPHSRIARPMLRRLAPEPYPRQLRLL